MMSATESIANVDWALGSERLNAGAKLLLVWLSRWADSDNAVSTTMPKVAVATGMDRRSVQRNLAALEWVGLVRVRRERGPGGGFLGATLSLVRSGGDAGREAGE